MSEEILARITASPVRRWFGVCVLLALALAVLSIAFTPEEVALTRRLPLTLLGLAVAGAGLALYRATALALELTPQGLRDSSGRMIAPMEQILGVDRGTFAFKPSNGFVLKLGAKYGLVLRPGLYWRIGKRAGIGGVLQGAETKQMADIIAVILAERAAQDQA